MNIVQASILNTYCNSTSNALLVITQANNSLSVYYLNAKGNIAHKFGKCDRKAELQNEDENGVNRGGLIWVSLSNYATHYKKLLKYFHPDYYKGKRTLNELTNIINVLSNIKRFNRALGIKALSKVIGDVDERPRHELSLDEYLNFSIFGILPIPSVASTDAGSSVPSTVDDAGFSILNDWVTSYQYLQNRHYSQQWSYDYLW